MTDNLKLYLLACAVAVLLGAGLFLAARERAAERGGNLASPRPGPAYPTPVPPPPAPPARWVLLGEVEVTAFSPAESGPRHRCEALTGSIRNAVAVRDHRTPMGTVVFIDDYGIGVVVDWLPPDATASYDVFFPKRAEALSWGRRRVLVWRLE